jgi:hypothetical protein
MQDRLQFSPEPSVFSSAFKELKIRIYTTIILPVVTHGHEIWSLTLRGEHRLRVKNGIFRVVTPCGCEEIPRYFFAAYVGC